MSSIDPEFEGNGNDGFEDMEIDVPASKNDKEYCKDGPVILKLVALTKGVAKSGSPKVVADFEFFDNPKKRYTKHFSLAENALWVIQQFICAIDEEQAVQFSKAKNGAGRAKLKKEHIGKCVVGINKNTKDGDKVFMDITKWVPLSPEQRKQVEDDLPF